MTEPEPRITERINFLRRRFRPRRRLFSGPLDSVPLVNVVLLLVLFLIIHSSYVVQPGITVDLPAAPFVSGAHYGAMVVTVSQEGLVFFNDERTTLEGLGAAFSQAAFDQPDSTLVIEADAQVRNATLVRIYNMAMSAGVKKVVLATGVTPEGGASR
jgi:biopolymer transport protein ExbD